MPIQIIPNNERRSFGEEVLSGLNAAQPALQGFFDKREQQYQLEQEDQSLKRQGFDLSGVKTPELRKELVSKGLQGKLDKAKFSEEVNRAKPILRAIEQERGLEPGSLDAFGADYKTAERVTKPAKKTQASQPIDPEQINIIKKVRSQPGFSDLDELGQYQELTNAGVSKENAAEESKLRGTQLTRKQQGFDNAYKAQQPFIDETTHKYNAFETEMKPRLLQMQNIPDEDLIGNGRENNIHVTLKYGLHKHDPFELRNLVWDFGIVRTVLDSISIFSSDEQDVVKIGVTSPDLHRLNKLIANTFDNTETHPVYVPHVTIAYVKPGEGKKYVGRSDFEGKKIILEEALFSGNDYRETVLPFRTLNNI